MTLKKTKRERLSEQLQRKIEDQCEALYPHLFDLKNYAPIDLHFVTEMQPHQIWRADFEPAEGAKGVEADEVYVVWNGQEIIFHEDDVERAFTDVLAEQNVIRMRERMMFLASPLVISGVLAIGLLLLIAYLTTQEPKVPPELWTIFTAVIAFYFGKEGWAAVKRYQNTEG